MCIERESAVVEARVYISRSRSAADTDTWRDGARVTGLHAFFPASVMIWRERSFGCASDNPLQVQDDIIRLVERADLDRGLRAYKGH